MDTERNDLSDEDSNQANELEGNVLRDSCLELDEAELSTNTESTTSVGDNSDKTNKLSSGEFEFVSKFYETSSIYKGCFTPLLWFRLCYRLGTSIS